MRTQAVAYPARAAPPGARLVLPCGTRLLHPIGEGGTSEVWEAHGPAGRVAVKILKPTLAARPGMTAVLQREAQKARLFSHPALVPVLASGTAAARPYIVYELLQGVLLADAKLGPLSRMRLARLLSPPAAALARLHAGGVVHGDVKPGNLFLETNGGVRLLDLGAARMAAGSALDATDWIPPHGMPALTPRWAAPERLRGEGPDPRDDVHSLAKVIVALLAGPPPRAVQAALRPRAERPACPVALVRSLLPWGRAWLA